MPGKRIDCTERRLILDAISRGDPIHKIAREFGRAKSSISRLLQRVRAPPPGTVPPLKPIPGRPIKISVRLLRRIKITLMKHPWLTAAELKNIYYEELNAVSIRTIQRRCQIDLHMPIRKAAKKPLLTGRMRRQRLEFARKMRRLTPDQWSRVLWSDESIFKCVANRRYCIRRPRYFSRYHRRFTCKTVRHPQSLMIWGAFSGAGGKAGLEFVPKGVTMTGRRYKMILVKHLARSMEEHGCQIFMHDGAPCHTAKIIKSYLVSKGIECMPWPGNSPDLNPIENAWNFIKNKVYKNASNMSLETLRSTVTQVWEKKLDKNYFAKLAASMPRRCREVIRAKGELTRY